MFLEHDIRGASVSAPVLIMKVIMGWDIIGGMESEQSFSWWRDI